MAFNPLDPMNHSMYLEDAYPSNVKEACDYVASYPRLDGAKLKPQLTQDSWYYSNDGADDGKISTKEKIKAFLKGGTYNMVKGMFCDENGFSLKRTLTTAAIAGAIALTGPVGLAVAGGVGLLAAGGNLISSVIKANNSTTDDETRKAYEGFGESATTAGLSLWGGLKGYKALKNNFSLANMFPNVKVSLWNKLTKWDITNKIINQLHVKPPVTAEPYVATAETQVITNPVGEGITPPNYNQQLALPSPADVRARMMADNQYPAGKLDLPPVETLLNEGKSPFKLPPQTVEAPLTEAVAEEVIVKPVKARRAPAKKKATTTKKTTTAAKPKRAPRKKVRTNILPENKIDIRNCSTEPNPDVEYFSEYAPTNTHPDTNYGEANHFFG